MTRNISLFLIALPRTAKLQEIFNLQSLCHISFRVEAYRDQSGLTQCHNCQQLCHVWANCRQPPSCIWCGVGHLHKECPEKENTASTPAYFNCQMMRERNPIPLHIGAADMQRRSCRRGRVSPQTSILQLIPSFRSSKAAHHRSSSLRHAKFQ